MELADGQELRRTSARVYAVGQTLIWLFPIPFALTLLTPGFWRIPVGVASFAVLVGGAARAWRIRFGADRRGIVIVNQWRVFRFGWDEVGAIVMIGQRLPTVSFVLTNGRVRRVQASSYNSSLRTSAWAIANTFAPSSVQIKEDPRIWRR
jgi:hypothetical protein